MHDLYWMFPERLDFWNREEEHYITACIDPELGWKEGWEYFPEKEQNSKPNEWNKPIMWYDRIEDGYLEKIWSILKDHVPDCLMDEEDELNPIKIEDSFWYYWLEKYKNNSEYIHGLKATFFNRDILSQKKPESSPSIITKSIDPIKRKLEVEIKELNPEYRQFLYYNIAYRVAGSKETFYMFDYDMPLSSLEGFWNQERYSTTITLPPVNSWSELWLMVHDSMLPIFKKYTNNIIIDEPGDIEDKDELIIEGSLDYNEIQKFQFSLCLNKN